MSDEELDRISGALDEVLQQGQCYVLILVTPAPGERSRVRTASTVHPGQILQLLTQVLEALAKGRAGEGRRMGAALAALPDALKVRMFETLETLTNGAGTDSPLTQAFFGQPIPAEAWRDLFLIWSASMAHDGGVSREDFLGGALETVDEEWSTANAEGRAAVGELLGKLGDGGPIGRRDPPPSR